jgi:hypothetical protein
MVGLHREETVAAGLIPEDLNDDVIDFGDVMVISVYWE